MHADLLTERKLHEVIFVVTAQMLSLCPIVYSTKQHVLAQGWQIALLQNVMLSVSAQVSTSLLCCCHCFWQRSLSILVVSNASPGVLVG